MELRKAILPDFEVLYQLRCEDTNVRWTGHKEAPNKDNFQDWFIKTLNNPTRDIYLYWEDNICIGYLYVDTIASKQYEIAYGISECYQGKGYATLMIAECLRQIEKMEGVKSVAAYISEHNKASQRVAQHNKFKKTEECYFADLPLMNGQQKFQKWIYEFEI